MYFPRVYERVYMDELINFEERNVTKGAKFGFIKGFEDFSKQGFEFGIKKFDIYLRKIAEIKFEIDIHEIFHDQNDENISLKNYITNMNKIIQILLSKDSVDDEFTKSYNDLSLKYQKLKTNKQYKNVSLQ